MDIQTTKLELIHLLLKTDNPQILDSIIAIFKNKSSTDFWDELSEDEKNEIEEATLQIEQGETTSFEEFMSKHR